MEAFNDEMARQEYEKWKEHYVASKREVWLASWRTLRDLFATKTFVPREPVVVHLPDGAKLPDNLPQFEGITYSIGGKPKE